MTLIVLTNLLLSGSSLAATPEVGAPGGLPSEGLAFAAFLLDLAEGRGPRAPATTAEALAALPDADRFLGARWDDYFRAHGLVPGPGERAALDRFAASSPAVAAVVRDLAGAVGAARSVRDEAFASLDTSDRVRLALALARAATGATDPDDARLLAAYDAPAVVSAGRVLAERTLGAERWLGHATALDARYAEAVSEPMLEGVRRQSVVDVLKAIAGDAPAYRAPPAVALGLAPHLPRGAAEPMANLLEAVRRAEDPLDDAAPRRLAATLAEAVAALPRAMANESGVLPAEVKPETWLSDPATAALMRFGRPGQPPAATLPAGLGALRSALGQPAADGDAVASLEAVLGRERANALGAALAAQAEYERSLARNPGEGDATERLGGVAASAEARRVRALEIAERAGAVAAAVASLASLGAMPAGPGDDDVVYDDGVLVVLGRGNTNVTGDVVPTTPVFLLDLGGHDLYFIPLAGVDVGVPEIGYPVDRGVARSSIAIDLDGDDRYVAPGIFSLGGARGTPEAPALAILHDASGSDTYVGRDRGLGWGVDGLGLLIDASGHDTYLAEGRGLGGALASTAGAIAIGLVADLAGSDRYVVDGALVRIEDDSRGAGAVAALVDVDGDDRYEAACAPNAVVACFATPRPGGAPDVEGLLVFVDGAGLDVYPRPSDPRGPFPAGTVAHHDVASGRSYVILDGPVGKLVADGDGDLLPDAIDRNPDDPDAVARDADGDGFTDAVEAFIGTDPNDAGSAPVGDPHGRGLLVDLPGLLAVGGSGPSQFEGAYALTIDLGLDDEDVYRGPTAFDGVHLDLGGNDVYAPPRDGPALAASRDRPAVFVDLGGNDRYAADNDTLASAVGSQAFAVFIDGGGHDAYRAENRSLAYANRGGVAWFVDLAGDDRYDSVTGAHVGPAGAVGSQAVFIDARGRDAYHVRAPDPPASVESGSSVELPPLALHARLSAFLDLEGHDTYRVGGEDRSDDLNTALRVNPREGAGPVAVFFDASGATEDADEDDAPGAVEAASGTSAGDASDAPTTTPGYRLRLPRLGLAVGDDGSTQFPTGEDYALVIDLGGNDAYALRAGASTAAWPVSVLIDLGGDDRYGHDTADPVAALVGFGLDATTSGDDGLVAASAGLAQGAGFLGIGILRDAGGNDRFEARASVRSESTACPPEGCLRVLGAFQGAGIGGFGLLSLGDGSALFAASAEAHGNATPPAGRPGASARTLAQGAGVFGAGLLVREGSAGDSYKAVAAATGPRADAASAAQGYGRLGLGILVDAGGNNQWDATRIAQGAADDVPGVEPVLASAPWSFGRPGLGLLVLSGRGDDLLIAHNASQAYAAGRGAGVVLDAGGDDARVLLAPDGGPALGQAAAHAGGVALLIDEHGNDRYEALGDRSQAYAEGALAALWDLSGADRYRATARAQAHLGPSNAAAPGLAFFFDRTGSDHYELEGSGGACAEGPGQAIFADGSGTDIHPPSGSESCPRDDPRGNGRSWSGPGATGIDDERLGAVAGLAHAALLRAGGVEAWIDVDGDPDALAGDILLSGGLKGTDGAAFLIDRVEFMMDDAWLGLGVAVEPGTWTLPWPTAARRTDGTPAFPDGDHVVTVHVFPRATLDAGPAAVGLDAEPFTARRPVTLDNPPAPRSLELPAAVSSLRASSWMLAVDPDRSRDAPRVPIATPAEDPWDTASPSPSLAGALARRAPCENDACVALRVTSGGGRVFFEWPPPAGDDVAGVLVSLSDGEGNWSERGYVDRRAPPRFSDRPGVADPVYRLDAVVKTAEGFAAVPGHPFAVAVSDDAGPASGLVAVGGHDAVALAWRPGINATAYEVSMRREGETFFQPLVSVSTTHYLHRVAEEDLGSNLEFAVAPAGRSGEVPVETVRARAAPGHETTVRFVGDGKTWSILDRAPLAGGARHVVTAAADPEVEGPRTVETAFDDGRGRRANATALVVVDGRAPVTEFHVPARGLGLANANASGLVVPFTSEDDRSGLDEVAIFANVNDAGWKTLARREACSGCRNLTGDVVLEGLADGDRVLLVGVARDRAGNVEGVAGLPWPIEADTVDDGLFARLAAGGLDPRIVDLSPPWGRASLSTRLLVLGERLDLAAEFQDAATRVASVTAHVGAESIALADLGNNVFGGTWSATTPGTRRVIVVARDEAENPTVLDLGLVGVRAGPPEVTSARAIFPEGRDVGRAGETVRLEVRVVLDGLDPDLFDVEADTSAVSSHPRVGFSWDDLAAAFVSEPFAADRVESTGDGRALVVVSDALGESAVVPVAIRTDGRHATASEVHVREIGPDHATVNWSTQSAARGYVELGLSPRLGEKTPLGPIAETHAIAVTGLKPETDYFARAVSRTLAGLETASPVFTFRTGPGLAVEASLEGDPDVRGPTRLAVRVTRWDGIEAEARVEAELVGPRGSPRIVGSAVAAPSGLVPLALAGVRDGDYTLIVRATDGAWSGISEPIPMRLDREAPVIVAASPLVVAGDVASMRFEERGSGIDLEGIVWRFGDVPCVPELAGDTLSCAIPHGVQDGASMSVTLPDRAGNVAAFATYVVRLAGAAPGFDVRVVSPRGGSILAPGETFELRARSVVPTETLMAELPWSEHPVPIPARGAVTVELPRDVPEGRTSIRIVASDGRFLEAPVEVDATPPEILGIRVARIRASDAELVVAAREPVSVMARAPGRTGPVESRSAGPSDVHVLPLRGLVPGAASVARIVIVDLAGHASTATVNVVTLPDRADPSPVARLESHLRADGLVELSWESAVDDVGVEAHVVVRDPEGAPTTWRIGPETRFVDRPHGPALYEVRAVDAAGRVGEGRRVFVGAGVTPVMERGTVEPPAGGPGLYRFSVVVRHASPVDVEVILDGAVHPLAPSAPQGSCLEGCRYSALVPVQVETLDGGGHRYAFRVHADGVAASWPPTPLAGPVVLAQSAAPGHEVGIPSITPGPDGWVVLAATLMVLALNRRRFSP